MVCCLLWLFFFFKQKTAYEMRISDWSSDVCSSDLRYRRNIRRLPRYLVTSRDVPVSQQRLFVGRGFRWEQRHTHRLMQTYRPEFRRYVEPTAIYRAARRSEEHTSELQSLMRISYAVFCLQKKKSTPPNCPHRPPTRSS